MLKQGSKLEITIDKIGTEGDGIGSFENFNVVVPLTAAGDKISCEVKYLTKDRIHANLDKIITPSDKRQTPPCVYFNKCGGCNLQHINEHEYRSYKIKLLEDAMRYNDIAIPKDGISWQTVGDASRRRALIRVDKKGNIGFYANQSHNVIDIENCLMLEPDLQNILSPIKNLSKKLYPDAWMLTLTDTGADIIMIEEKPDKKINEANIIEQLSTFAHANKISRISWKRGNDLINIATIKSPALLINNFNIKLPEEYFLQASKKGQEAITKIVSDNISANSSVLDLFAGIGVYSFAIAEKSRKISSYEISRKMVKAIENNIAANMLSGKISAHLRDIEKDIFTSHELVNFDTAIINPPRTGAKNLSESIAESDIKNVIMVSCNSKTFTRDAKILLDSGFKLLSLHAIDQFYYTQHLEQVGIFKR